MKQFPTSYEIPCIYPQLQHSASTVFVDVPGSKSITNRALLLATLADGTSTLKGVLFSDDSRHFLSCIQALGFETQVDEKKAIITIKGENGRIPLKEASQYVGSAGNRRPLSHSGTRRFQRSLSHGCFRADEKASHGSSVSLP